MPARAMPATPKNVARGRRDRLDRLLRSSHLFASTVREILEVRLLDEVAPAPLSPSQFHLLKLIVRSGEHPVGQMAEFLGVSAAAASKAIDKLEGLGLLARKVSAGDRRVCLIAASQAGKELVSRYEQRTSEHLAPVLARFQPAEIDELSRLLERFAVHLLKLEEPGSGMCLRCAAYVDDHCPVAHAYDNCPYQKMRAGSQAASGAA